MEERKERRNKTTKSVGNGEGSLYWSEALQCLIYQYIDRTDGKRKTMKQKKNEGKGDFRKRVTKLKEQMDSGTYIGKSKDTFISILKKYIEQKHDDGITSDRSYCRDLSTISQIEKSCSNFINKPIQNIRVEDIEESKKYIREYSNSVISKIWTFINKTFQIATSRRKIPFNIMLDETLTKPISKKPQEKIEALTIDEEKAFIEVLNGPEFNHKYRDILLLQLYTGMRIGEVLALSVDCVDLKNNTLTIYRTLTQDENYHVIMGEHTKTFKKSSGIDKGRRTFPMNTNVRLLIEKILNNKKRNINGLLFYDEITDNYISPNSINSYLSRINAKYQISDKPLHTHRLRHTFITRCAENGLSLKVIQTIVGHVRGSLITENVYTSVSNEFIEQELKKLG